MSTTDLTTQTKARLRLLLSGLAAGDSLGATSEFVPQARVPEVYASCRAKGWPFRQVGGGTFGWRPGEPTDDTQMAMRIVRSFLDRGEFDGQDVAQRFVEWMRSGPRDIGNTTRRTLAGIAAGAKWFEGGLAEYRRNPGNAANGSLMRNGVTPALAKDLDDAFRVTVSHSVMTHYAPLPVLCCAAQTFLIRELLEGRNPIDGDWLSGFRESFTLWIAKAEDEPCAAWRASVGDHLEQAWETLTNADFDADSFSPFATSFAGKDGYCLLTLQIAVWAATWAKRNVALPDPPGYAAEVFARTGPWTLSWVVLIGHDADTYGATAGPLIAAACGDLPEALTDGLQALAELDGILGHEV